MVGRGVCSGCRWVPGASPVWGRDRGVNSRKHWASRRWKIHLCRVAGAGMPNPCVLWVFEHCWKTTFVVLGAVGKPLSWFWALLENQGVVGDLVGQNFRWFWASLENQLADTCRQRKPVYKVPAPFWGAAGSDGGCADRVGGRRGPAGGSHCRLGKPEGRCGALESVGKIGVCVRRPQNHLENFGTNWKIQS